MHQLPAAFAAMAALRQFIVYKVVPSARPGKTDKLPMDWRSGAVVSAHDAQHWTDAANACAAAQLWGGGHGVGFVFTEQAGFWFLDIDDCLMPDGQWSPIAQQLCGLLRGAAVEVSQSGRGLHLFGRGVIPPHRSKNAEHHLELYHTGRFVALTGIGAMGDCSTSHSAALSTIVSAYFPAAELATEAYDSEGPVPQWRGPVDDDELLRRAMSSSSAGAVFGHKASFADLWHADSRVLATAYPSSSGGEWDYSSADQALLQHLAFWTGKDAPRMERLARRSKLADRGKWERPDYLPRSIASACRMQRDVCQDKPPEPPPGTAGLQVVQEQPAAAGGAGHAGAPASRSIEGTTLLFPDHQRDYFAGCVWVQDRDAVLTPAGALLNKSRFNTQYGGRSFVMDRENSRSPSRDAWEAFTQSQVIEQPRVETTAFKPLQPFGTVVMVDGRRAVNIWRDPKVRRVQGDPAPFLNHLQRLLPDEGDRAQLLAYFAACVQHQGTKFQWAPFIQGTPGNGKTTLSRCVAYACGPQYVHWPKASKLAERFNGWLTERVLYCVEDVFVPREQEHVFEQLKPMITGGAGLEVERKGVDAAGADVVGNFLLNSNHKDGLRKTRDDRRIAPYFTAQQEPEDVQRDGMGREYMDALYAWLEADGYAIVAEFLWTYQIPRHLNPAFGGVAPITTSTADMVLESRSQAADELAELLEQGGRSGLMGGWVSSMAVDRELKLLGIKLGPRRRAALLKEMGYVTHPGLVNGRASRNVLPDAAQPTLYIKRGSPLAALADPCGAYSAAQTSVQ
jgi:hypothetical protein